MTAAAVLEDRLLDNYITEEELWACTSCRACVQECPVSIDQLDVINEMRRYLVLTESRFPEEVQPAFESLERNGSPWAFNPGDRGAWADGMDILTMAELTERGDAARRVVLGRLHGIVRRSREEDHRRVCAHPQGVRHQLRDPRPGRALPRRSRAPHGQRVSVPDAREGHDRDARSLSGQDDRHELPALLPSDRQRVPAARRQLRGHPPLDVHRAAAAREPRAAAVRRGKAARRSRITTRAISAATTTCTRRRARRCKRALARREPRRAEAHEEIAGCAAAPAAAGCSWKSAKGSASTSSAPKSCSRPAPTRSPWRARSA